MELTGIKDLMAFLQYLHDMRGRPWYLVRHVHYDAVTVELRMPGIRLEVDFFEDHVEYGIFEGDESVHDDIARLIALIEERGR